MKKILEFVVPEGDIESFATGVIDTLEQLAELGIDYDFDETSPPNEEGEVTYRVYGVRKT